MLVLLFHSVVKLQSTFQLNNEHGEDVKQHLNLFSFQLSISKMRLTSQPHQECRIARIRSRWRCRFRYRSKVKILLRTFSPPPSLPILTESQSVATPRLLVHPFTPRTLRAARSAPLAGGRAAGGAAATRCALEISLSFTRARDAVISRPLALRQACVLRDALRYFYHIRFRRVECRARHGASSSRRYRRAGTGGAPRLLRS